MPLQTKQDINQINQDVQRALSEDLGVLEQDALIGSLHEQDLHLHLIDKSSWACARIITRERCIFCAQAWAESTFKYLSPEVSINWHVSDGEAVEKDATICEIKGPAGVLLTGERTALNFLQLACGVATKVHNFKQQLPPDVLLRDTRKTLPGLRALQKYAVLMGGGSNHRFGLYDAYLLKENHLMAAGGIKNAVLQARSKQPKLPIQVEVENLTELQQAIDAEVDSVLLDNFSNDDLIKAVAINQGRIFLEASGNITERNMVEIAKTGINAISLGTLTKDIQSIDFSMRFFG